MDLFTCRNCIHSPAQGLTFGPGPGFCFQWGSVLEHPERTTCKYLHRKDLPRLLARGAHSEHEEEFSGNRAIADIETRDDVPVRPFGGKGREQAERIDPATRDVARCYALVTSPRSTLAQRSWLISRFAGSYSVRRASAHACLVRGMGAPRACHQWRRGILDLVGEVSSDLDVRPDDLVGPGAASPDEARWEVAYLRLSAIQEYGWHAASEGLKYPMGELGALAADQNWEGFLAKLREITGRWVEAIEAQGFLDVLQGPGQDLTALWPRPGPRFEGLFDRSVREGEPNNRFRSMH